MTELTANAIHLGCSDSMIAVAEDCIRAAGGTPFRLDLRGVSDRPALVGAFVDTFQVPWPIDGLDAVISTASDLDWIAGARRFSVCVEGLDASPPDVLRDLAIAFSRIIDRMRGAGDGCTVLFPESRRTTEVAAFLAGENERLAELERNDPDSDTHPVPVIDHRLDPVSDD
jgi:hypothetical protein